MASCPQLPLFGYTIFSVRPANPEQFGFTVTEAIEMVNVTLCLSRVRGSVHVAFSFPAQDLAIGISGLRVLNKDTHTPINSTFASNIYYNQLTEWSYTATGVKLVVDEAEGGLVRTLEMITACVSPSSLTASTSEVALINQDTEYGDCFADRGLCVLPERRFNARQGPPGL